MENQEIPSLAGSCFSFSADRLSVFTRPEPLYNIGVGEVGLYSGEKLWTDSPTRRFSSANKLKLISPSLSLSPSPPASNNRKLNGLSNGISRCYFAAQAVLKLTAYWSFVSRYCHMGLDRDVSTTYCWSSSGDDVDWLCLIISTSWRSTPMWQYRETNDE